MLRGRYVIGVYEVKTSAFVLEWGIKSVWPRAVVEAVALNHEAHRGGGLYFVPVFGGDFNQHLVVHAAPPEMDGDFMLHVATTTQIDMKNSSDEAVRYMKYLLQQTKEAVEKHVQGMVQSEACMHRQYGLVPRDINMSAFLRRSLVVNLMSVVADQPGRDDVYSDRFQPPIAVHVYSSVIFRVVVTAGLSAAAARRGPPDEQGPAPLYSLRDCGARQRAAEKAAADKTAQEPAGQDSLTGRVAEWQREAEEAADKTAQEPAGPDSPTGRHAKRQREAEEAADEAESEPHDADDIDDDPEWQARENAFHRSVVELLRDPRMYTDMGLSGPPTTIRHASLREWLGTWRLLPTSDGPAESEPASELASGSIQDADATE